MKKPKFLKKVKVTHREMRLMKAAFEAGASNEPISQYAEDGVEFEFKSFAEYKRKKLELFK